jgi:pimeloyl-ACP methyl ester carboxylesterase
MQRSQVIVNGHPISYAECGTGSPVLLLHGGGDSGEHAYAKQLDFLASHHRLVAPDQVGQGHTPDVPGALSYRAMSEDTAALLVSLGLERVDVIGFSDGGILALMLAIRYPQLLRRIVISGVNIAPRGLSAQFLEGLRAQQTTSPGTLDERLAALWLTSPTEADIDPRALAKIAQPTLVICGDRDVITLEHTLEIYRALAHGELCILPGTGHTTFSDRPEWLNPIIGEFIER